MGEKKEEAPVVEEAAPPAEEDEGDAKKKKKKKEGRQVKSLLLDHAYRRTNGSCSWSGLNRLTMSAVQWLAAARPWSPPSLKHSSDLANHMAWMFHTVD